MKIGFIGLGIMGSRMASNLQKRGHSLVVFNRTREKADPLVAEGARWADSPAALAQQVEVIFTMLAHPDAVDEVVLGTDGILSHLGPDQMWVDCSTVNPSFSEKDGRTGSGERHSFPRRPGDGLQGPGGGCDTHFLGGGREDRFGNMPAFTGMHGKQDYSLRRTRDGGFS